MATGTINTQPTNTNELQQSTFELKFQKLPLVTYFGTSIPLPGIAIEEVNQTSRFSDIKQPGDRITYEELEITFIVSEDLKNWKEIFDWMRQIAPSIRDSDIVDHSDKANIFSDATLIIKNSSQNPVAEVTFRDVFPKGLSAIGFDFQVTDAEVVLATANFGYSTYDLRLVG